LLIGIAAQASPAANFAPYFAGGTRQAIAVCGDSGPLTVNSELAIVDSDAGQTESWSVSTPPAHGTLGGFPVTATSTGGVVTPSWLYYTPAAGFAGIDSFTVAATDGAANATTTIVVTVNPTPALTSALTGSVCDQGVFSYTPVTSPAGVTVTWHRASMPGISNPPNSGTGNPNEPLYNITNDDAVTTYNFSMSANGCSSNANVVVTVHPTPRLSSPGTDSVCSGGILYYVPASPTAGTSFSWSRSAVAGIEPNAPSSGSGTINEVLTNTTGAPLSTIYSFMLQAHGCTAARSLLVTVLPPEAGTPITTHTAATVCSGAQFQNFGAAAAPAPGYSYAWSATNATVWATGSTSQYCLVSFDAPGEAVVTLTTGSGVGCASGSTYTVLVGNDIAAPGTVIYYNNQFVFQDNTQDTYQWGYDDAATLDSALIQGATFQSYGNATPDLTGKYYWVLTTRGGCMQKTYFNTPLSICCRFRSLAIVQQAV
jgi:hypothetical protein